VTHRKGVISGLDQVCPENSVRFFEFSFSRKTAFFPNFYGTNGLSETVWGSATAPKTVF
jgi:hypothetical protein